MSIWVKYWWSDFLPEPSSNVFQRWSFVSPEWRHMSRTSGDRWPCWLSTAGIQDSPTDNAYRQQQLVPLLMDGLSVIQLPSLNMETLYVRTTKDLFSRKSVEANPHSCRYKGKIWSIMKKVIIRLRFNKEKILKVSGGKFLSWWPFLLLLGLTPMFPSTLIKILINSDSICISCSCWLSGKALPHQM